MASKLKILVDHTCDVFCDYELIGQAIPDKLFYFELRKGKYILEFKVKDDIENRYIYTEAFDYIMDSNDEDDLIRINLLNHISFKKIDLPSSFGIYNSEAIKDIDGYSYWKYYLYVNNNDSSIDIPIIKGQKKVKLTLSGKKCYYDYFDSDDKEVFISIEQEISACNQTILYDYRFINSLGFIIYTNDNIFIYNNDSNSNNRWLLSKVLPRFGYIYEIHENIVFFLNNNKFGLFDINKEILLVKPVYDKIFNMFGRQECGIQRAFTFNKDKTFYVENNGLLGKIDINGNIIVPVEYQSIFKSFFGNVVKQDDKWGFYSKEGIKYWLDDIYTYDPYLKENSHFDDDVTDILFCRKGKKLGFWNCVGKLSGIIYDSFDTSHLGAFNGDDFIFTKRNGKIGLTNIHGIIFIECLYDEIIFCYYESLAKYIFNIFPSFVYYTMTNKKTDSYLKWEKEQIESGKLKANYALEEAKELIYTPQLVVRNGDKYGVVKFDNTVELPVEFSEDEAHNYILNTVAEKWLGF